MRRRLTKSLWWTSAHREQRSIKSKNQNSDKQTNRGIFQMHLDYENDERKHGLEWIDFNEPFNSTDWDEVEEKPCSKVLKFWCARYFFVKRNGYISMWFKEMAAAIAAACSPYGKVVFKHNNKSLFLKDLVAKMQHQNV